MTEIDVELAGKIRAQRAALIYFEYPKATGERKVELDGMIRDLTDRLHEVEHRLKMRWEAGTPEDRE